VRFLLDTHVLLWWLVGDPRLGATAHELLRDASNEVLLSAVSVLEMAIKAAPGGLVLPVTSGELAADAVAEDGFTPLPITLEHAAAVERLPRIHADPFDRLLVAQAQVEGVPLVTADRVLGRYDVTIAW